MGKHEQTAAETAGVKSLGLHTMESTLEEATKKNDSSLMHPASGLAILGLDWLLFGGNTASLYTLTPLIALLGFLVGGGVVYLTQTHLTSDESGPAIAKAIAGGLLVGVPTPIVGTVTGAGVLAISGLTRLVKGR